LKPGQSIAFIFFWQESGHWANMDVSVAVGASDMP
jgi:hypothetical protein